MLAASSRCRNETGNTIGSTAGAGAITVESTGTLAVKAIA